jgi:hypothetical protein
MNRRSLLQLIIGVAAAIVGLMSVPWLRQGRCVDANATWVPASQSCMSSGGPLDVSRPYDYMIGLVIGLALVFMMHRASTFAARRRVRKPE